MPQINIRWADNTEQLRARLREGVGAIDAMKAAVDKTVKSMGGEGLFKAANNVTAAIIQMGGATKLTASEQARANDLLTKAIEKYRVMGLQVPPAMREIAEQTKQLGKNSEAATVSLETMRSVVTGLAGAFGVAFSVGAVVAFAKETLSAADSLVKLHDKTGISLQGLQKLQIAGDDAGNSIEDLTGAVNQMQKRLAGDDKSAVAALNTLGLSLETLKAMAPDQQFMKIGEAIKGVKDPAEQVALAMALFGKGGAEVLPTLKRGFDDLKDSTVGMSDEAVKGLDEIGDAAARTLRRLKAVTGEVIFLATVKSREPSAEQMARDFAVTPGDVTATAAKNAPALRMNAIKNLTLSEDEEAATVRELNAAYQDHHEKSLQAQKDAADLARATDAIHKVEAGFFGLSKGVLEFVSAADLADQRFSAAVIKIGELEQGTRIAQFGFRGMADELGTLGTKIAPSIHDLDAFGDLVKFVGPIKLAKDATDDWADSFKKLPDLITAAFTGGGGLVGALKAFGNEISKSLFGEKGPLSGWTSGLTSKVASLFSGLGGTASKLLGGIAGSLLPGIGGLIGPLLGKLFGGIGGPSAAEKAGREVSASFSKGIADSLTAEQKAEAGGESWKATVIGVRDAYLATGRSAAEAERDVARLWAAEKQGPEAVKRVQAEIQKAFDQQKLIAGGVDNVVNAWQKAGTQIPASMRESIKSLLTMNGLTDAQREKLQGLLDSSKPNFEQLKSEAEGFGISLAGLGPKFQQGDLEGRAKKLTDFISNATDAGGDLGGILAGTADEFSALVQEAATFGTAIPENMRPYIQNLIDAGKLLDDNGKAITDITGIKFEATPLDQGLKTLNDTLIDLMDTLTNLPNIMKGLPPVHIQAYLDLHPLTLPPGTTTTPPTDQNTTEPPTPPFNPTEGGSTGGLVTPYGIEPSLFRARGTDTVPAMLTPGESVLTREATALLGADAIKRLNSRMMYFSGGGIVNDAIWEDGLSKIISTMETDDNPPIGQPSVNRGVAFADHNEWHYLLHDFQSALGTPNTPTPQSLTDYLGQQLDLYKVLGNQALTLYTGTIDDAGNVSISNTYLFLQRLFRDWISAETLNQFDALERYVSGPLEQIFNSLSAFDQYQWRRDYAVAVGAGPYEGTAPGFLADEYLSGSKPGRFSGDTTRDSWRAALEALLGAPAYMQSGGIAWSTKGLDSVPAMLTPGELILNHAQQSVLSEQLRSINNGGTVVLKEENHFDFSGMQFLDGAGLDEFIEKKALPRIVNELEDRRRGYTGRIRKAIQDGQ